MKSFIRILFLIVIICSAVISVRYAAELYRNKYTPRYLMYKTMPSPKIEIAQLGNEAGIIGAGLLGLLVNKQ